ncbi:MAG: CHAD domain-containing protein [Acidimicrobiales bacterium]
MTAELDFPTTEVVLHRVLAHSARNFLLNDAHPAGGGAGSFARLMRADARTGAPTSPILPGGEIRRRLTDTARVRQTRVALRRIRSNLRTFRLAFDPVWSTSLRAELAWYAECLGGWRDLQVLRDMLSLHGPLLVDPVDLQPILETLDQSITGAMARVAEARDGERHAGLVAQMQLLGDLPRFTRNGARPAAELMPSLLHRAWLDMRGAGRTAKKDATERNLHKLRIRLKGLRYGCETVALVAGDPAKRTAGAAEVLQRRLGGLHDATVSIGWLHALVDDRPELARPCEALILVQQAAVSVARRGWKDDLREIERRWRTWQG